MPWWMRRLLEQSGADGGSGGGGAGGGTGSGTGAAAGANGGQGSGGSGTGGSGGILSGGANGAGGGQGDGQGAGGAGAGTGTEAPWLWAENQPGTGDRPAWFKGEKFKSVAAQAEAYVEAERQLGPARGFFGEAPAEGYKPPQLPQEIGGEFDTDSPLFKSFSEFAKKEGISQAGFEKLALFYAQVEAQQAQAEQERVTEALSKLGANLQTRLEAIKGYITQHVGAEGYTALDNAIGTNVEAFQALEKLIAVAANDGRLAGAGGQSGLGFTRADVEAKRYARVESGPNAGQLRYEVDPAYREEVDAMWKKLYPGESNQQQVG